MDHLDPSHEHFLTLQSESCSSITNQIEVIRRLIHACAQHAPREAATPEDAEASVLRLFRCAGNAHSGLEKFAPPVLVVKVMADSNIMVATHCNVSRGSVCAGNHTVSCLAALAHERSHHWRTPDRESRDPGLCHFQLAASPPSQTSSRLFQLIE